MENLSEGLEVFIFEDGKRVDRGVIKKHQEDTLKELGELQVESKEERPGEIKRFVFVDGWALIFKDPFTDQDCYSRIGSRYTFLPVS